MPQKRPELTVNDLVEWLNKKYIIYASAGKRELSVSLTGNFIVEFEGIVKYNGNQPDKAIQTFNEL